MPTTASQLAKRAKPTNKAGTGVRYVSPADRDQRREQVLQLRLWGYSQVKIAKTLNVPRRTVQNDWYWIDAQLVKDALPTLQIRIAESVAVYKEVEQAAWKLYLAANDTSLNKAGALNTVITARKEIDALQGTTAPEKVYATALAESQAVLMRTLERVGGEDLQLAFLLALQEETRAGMNTLLLQGRNTYVSEQEARAAAAAADGVVDAE